MTSKTTSLPDCSVLSISKLSLTNFRNYDQTTLDSGGKSVILTGSNGAGKTNILEAISLLTPGRGLRGASIDDYQNMHTDNPWAVSSACTSMVGQARIGTGRGETPKRRAIRINGDGVKQADLAEYMSCVWLTPQMDRLFNGGASSRRRFLDRLILGFDKAHAGRISGYEKALRSRSHLLKDNCQDDTWLSSLEREISQRGIAIGATRLHMTHRLNQVISNGFDGLNGFPGAHIDIKGVVEDWLKNYSASESEDLFQNALKQSRPLDAVSGGAHIGTHKTDIHVQHLDKNMEASLCSTGEQKALLISIILGDLQLQKFETGHMPILLLDEIPAHLDTTKLNALFDGIDSLAPQVWYTGTKANDFSLISKVCSNFIIEENTIIPCI